MKILLKSAGVHHAERGIADQATDHHHPAGNREAELEKASHLTIARVFQDDSGVES